MALFSSQFAGAFQIGAFQSNAFQVDLARVDTGGDIATPAEIAYLERRRRVQQYLDDRRKRYDLQRLRKIDAKIDQLLSTRQGAHGERHESEARPELKDAQSAVQPHTIIRGAGRPELKGLAPPRSKPPVKRPNKQRSSKSIQLLSTFGREQAGQQLQALNDLLAIPMGPSWMPPDHLLAALAQGNAQYQQLRQY